jgi:hypothetical protein
MDTGVDHPVSSRVCADPSVTGVPPVPVRRPKLMARLVAGIGVVVAALVPVAALVFLILHIFNAVTFT